KHGVVRLTPALPQSRKSEYRTVECAKVVRLFLLRSNLFPLVESVGRDQTTAVFEGIAEHRFYGSGLRHRVNRLEPDRRVLGPVRNQAPAHEAENTRRFLRVLPDGGDHLRGRDVPAR